MVKSAHFCNAVTEADYSQDTLMTVGGLRPLNGVEIKSKHWLVLIKH